jgi:cytochrome b561
VINPLRYTKVAMGLHWLIAILILCNLIIAQGVEDIKTAADIEMMQLHKSIGITVLLLTLIRMAWRLTHKAPPLPAEMPAWEKLVANLAHLGLYGFMLAIPLTGWMIVSISPLNIPTVLYTLLPWPHLPKEAILNTGVTPELVAGAHQLLAYGALALAALHAGAALRHHFVVKDDVLLRMTPRFADGFLKKARGEKQ